MIESVVGTVAPQSDVHAGVRDPESVWTEARRVLHLCNLCGYCNGFCAVFSAAQRHRALSEADVRYLAHLCHACRNCFYACQYAPPHRFAVNVPRALAEARHATWVENTWPRALAAAFVQPRATAWGVTAVALALLFGVVLGRALLLGPEEADAFYRLIPWSWMMVLGGVPLGWAALVCGRSWRQFARTIGVTAGDWRATQRALGDLLRLRQLRGGGLGCNDRNERFSAGRRRWHQLLLLGVALCLAATLTAAVFHHGCGWRAPYPRTSLPVVFGTLGGLALLVASAGLAVGHWRADMRPRDAAGEALDRSLLALLVLVSASGLALMAGRDGVLLPLWLAAHLGSVVALLLLLPYGKFVHAGYRWLALRRAAQEGLTPPVFESAAQVSTPVPSSGDPHASLGSRLAP